MLHLFSYAGSSTTLRATTDWRNRFVPGHLDQLHRVPETASVDNTNPTSVSLDLSRCLSENGSLKDAIVTQ